MEKMKTHLLSLLLATAQITGQVSINSFSINYNSLIETNFIKWSDNYFVPKSETWTFGYTGWLLITPINRDEFYSPSNTRIETKCKPVVLKQKDKWVIYFEEGK